MNRDRARRPRIAADDFARSLVEALDRHQTGLQSFVRVDTAAMEHAQDRHRQATDAVRRQRHLQDQRRGRLDGSDGRPLLDGPAYTQVMDAFNAGVAKLAALEREAEQSRQDLYRATHADEPRSLAAAQALAAVASLRDPYATDYAIHWRRALRDVRVQTELVNIGGRRATLTRWTGSLWLSGEQDVYGIPFAGQTVFYSRRLRRDVHGVLAALRAGRPLPEESAWFSSAGQAVLRHVLAVPANQPMPLLRVHDTRGLRIGMEILYPPLRPAPGPDAADLPPLAGPQLTPRQLPAAARRLDEPLALVKRIACTTGREQHLPGVQRKWVTAGDQAVARLLHGVANRGEIRSRDHDSADWEALRHAAVRMNTRACTGQTAPRDPVWSLRYGRLSIDPCLWCGRIRPLALLIREATEPVCAACRRDVTGILWPARPYDNYRLRIRT